MKSNLVRLEVSKVEFGNEFKRFQLLNQEPETFKAQMQELADSIKSTGLINPITVIEKKDGSFECVAGNRRLLAHKKFLKTTHIDAMVVDDVDSFAVALNENLQRVNLTPLEIGQWITVAEGHYKDELDPDGKHPAKLFAKLSNITGIKPARLMEMARVWQKASDKEKQEVLTRKRSSTSVQRDVQKRSTIKRKKSPVNLSILYCSRSISDINGKGENLGVYKRLVFINKHLEKFEKVPEDFKHSIIRLNEITSVLTKRL